MQSASTSSNSYNEAGLTARVTPSEFAAGSNPTLRVHLGAEVNDNSNQIDIRVQNTTDGETVVESTDAGDGSGGNVDVHTAASYTPTTVDSGIILQVQHKNGDDATSVTTRDETLTITTE